MAPKKKPPQKGKADGEVDLFEEFQKKYREKQKEYDSAKFNEAQAIIQQITDEGEDIPAWNFSQEFDPMSFRVLFHSLRLSGYGKMRALRLWKCGGGDESVRSVCYFLDSEPPPDVEEIQITDNGLTPLGCEFIGRTLGPGGNKTISFVRLDCNHFGAEGVQKLSLGLSQNATLRYLSMQYCNIGEAGGQYIAHILMFVRSALEELSLKGNCLGQTGIVEVFNGARRAKCLKCLDVFDNKFSETPEVIQGLRDLFAHNTKTEKYDLRGNHITDVGARELITGMIGHSHIREVLVPQQCSVKTFEALEFQLGATKKKGKGKKKK